MRIITDVRNTDVYFERVVLTIGCFDGIHLGHQEILKTLKQEADAINGVAAVMTLEPHPRLLFSPDNSPNILTHGAMKERLLAAQGVDVLFVLPFDPGTASLPPKEFVEKILVKQCRVRVIIVGHDFAFGYRAQGNYEYLTSVAHHFDFRVIQTPPLIIGGQRVSSTLIRERVIQGEVEQLNQFLGRPYVLSGRIIPGRGIGKTLGFPTANLDAGSYAIPAHGVYAAKAIVGGERLIAAVNIGIAPTIRNEIPLIEAHLPDWTGDIVGREMEIEFYRRLRPEKKFESHEALMKAIAEDIQSIRTYFNTLEA